MFLSSVQLFETPLTAAGQAPLAMEFPRQEYWSGLPFPSSGDLPDSETEIAAATLAGGLFTTEPSPGFSWPVAASFQSLPVFSQGLLVCVSPFVCDFSTSKI